MRLGLIFLLNILFLCLQNYAVYGDSTSSKCQLKVCNGAEVLIEVMLKNQMNIVNVGWLKPKTCSNYRSINAEQLWNITMRDTYKEFMLKKDISFGKIKKSVIVVYNDSSSLSSVILDAEPTEDKGKQSTDLNENINLGIDEALLRVKSFLFKGLTVNWKSDNCFKCLEQELLNVKQNSTATTKIDTRWPVHIMIRSTDGKAGNSCNFTVHYGEHGQYEIVVMNLTSAISCEHKTIKKPGTPYIPIAVMFGIIIALILIFSLWNHICWKRYQRQREYELSQELGKPRNFLSSGTGSTTSAAQEADQNAIKAKKRLKSLDAFRGVAITIMIFVNYGGGHYYFLEHSLWNGLTVADLVFPWFIFIMGTSIDLSQRSLLSKGIRKQTIFKKIIIRSLKLFAIGLFLNNGRDLNNWRIPGVLQRFAISYLVVAAVSLYLSPSEEAQDVKRRFDWTDQFREIWLFWSQWVVMFVLLAIYLMVTFFLHEKGCPRGFLGTGGIGDYGKYPHCTGGAAGYIDRMIFGKHHMYNHPTCKPLYKTTVPYDPEGILGSLTSIFLTYLGLHAGRILFTHNSPSARISRWLLCALFWGAIAIGLAGGTKNEGIVPINKNLWSPSFIFANASLAYILLTFMFIVIDVNSWWDGGPFTFAGMNAIFLYCGHEVFHNFFPFNFVANPQTHATALTRSAVGVSVWMIVAYYLYVEKMFFKV